MAWRCPLPLLQLSIALRAPDHHWFHWQLREMHNNRSNNCPVRKLLKCLSIGVAVTEHVKRDIFLDAFPLRYFCENIIIHVSVSLTSTLTLPLFHLFWIFSLAFHTPQTSLCAIAKVFKIISANCAQWKLVFIHHLFFIHLTIARVIPVFLLWCSKSEALAFCSYAQLLQCAPYCITHIIYSLDSGQTVPNCNIQRGCLNCNLPCAGQCCISLTVVRKPVLLHHTLLT